MSADVRAGLVNLDQVDFHPHNIRRELGDLRPLAASINSYGLVSPIAVERNGDRLRLRAGHRRVAAARLAGIKRLPALIYAERLDDDEWLAGSVQENVLRRGIDDEERRRTILALRDLDYTWQGIAEVFGVALPTTVQKWSLTAEERAAVRGAPSPAPVRRPVVRALADRWEGRAPAALIEEIRAVAATGKLPEQAP